MSRVEVTVAMCSSLGFEGAVVGRKCPEGSGLGGYVAVSVLSGSNVWRDGT